MKYMMFKVENNVPDIYIQESRDFQLFARLYDLIFQCSRFSIDSMKNISDSMRCQDTLLPLLSTKVGFFTDTRLTDSTHRKILSAFPYIIKYKGSKHGLELIANLFGVILNTSVTVELSETDKSKIVISFDKYAPDFALLDDLLYYMRPTGCLIDYKITSSSKTLNDYDVSDFVKINYSEDNVTDILINNAENFVNYTEDYTTDIESCENIYDATVGFTQIYDNETDITEGGDDAE